MYVQKWNSSVLDWMRPRRLWQRQRAVTHNLLLCPTVCPKAKYNVDSWQILFKSPQISRGQHNTTNTSLLQWLIMIWFWSQDFVFLGRLILQAVCVRMILRDQEHTGAVWDDVFLLVLHNIPTRGSWWCLKYIKFIYHMSIINNNNKQQFYN